MSMEYHWNDTDSAVETEVLGERPVPMSLFHHKSHVDWPGTEPGPLRWEPATDLSEPFHSPDMFHKIKA